MRKQRMTILVGVLIATLSVSLSVCGLDSKALTTHSLKELRIATQAYSSDYKIVVDGSTKEPKLILSDATGTNVGTAGTGVTAVEFGDKYVHTTVLTVSQADAITLGDNASLADGYLIYTLPAGAVVVNSAYLNIDVSNAEHTTEATDIGLGTTIGTGAVATLDGTAGFENIATGFTGAIDTASVTTDICNSTAGTGGLIIQSGNPHLIHINVAGAWADTAGTALDASLTGTVVIHWTFME
jgi:hypothetical protein